MSCQNGTHLPFWRVLSLAHWVTYPQQNRNSKFQTLGPSCRSNADAHQIQTHIQQAATESAVLVFAGEDVLRGRGKVVLRVNGVREAGGSQENSPGETGTLTGSLRSCLNTNTLTTNTLGCQARREAKAPGSIVSSGSTAPLTCPLPMGSRRRERTESSAELRKASPPPPLTLHTQTNQ